MSVLCPYSCSWSHNQCRAARRPNRFFLPGARETCLRTEDMSLPDSSQGLGEKVYGSCPYPKLFDLIWLLTAFNKLPQSLQVRSLSAKVRFCYLLSREPELVCWERPNILSAFWHRTVENGANISQILQLPAEKY